MRLDFWNKRWMRSNTKWKIKGNKKLRDFACIQWRRSSERVHKCGWCLRISVVDPWCDDPCGQNVFWLSKSGSSFPLSISLLGQGLVHLEQHTWTSFSKSGDETYWSNFRATTCLHFFPSRHDIPSPSKLATPRANLPSPHSTSTRDPLGSTKCFKESWTGLLEFLSMKTFCRDRDRSIRLVSDGQQMMR